MSQLIWDVLEQAGWLGCAAGLRPALELHIRVAPACGIRQPAAPRFTPLPGGQRRHGDRFLVEDDGRIRAAYVGPLHARAVTGIRLVDSERRAEDFDVYEDLLYDAAVQAGWLPDTPDEATHGDVPDAEILVRIPRNA